MENCKCCFIGCDELAVIEIWDDPRTPNGNTQACQDHVGALTPDGKHTFHKFGISGDADTISEAPIISEF